MAVSDLTGTTWVWTEVPQGTGLVEEEWVTYNISFSSNSITYTSLQVWEAEAGTELSIYYGNNTSAYEFSTGWVNNAYKTISITGGTDATNGDLIAWLEANATQQSSQLTVDLSALSGWSNVSSGSHTLTIKAKASGYRDSDASTGVSFVKGGTGHNLTINFVARNYAGGKGENYLRIKLNGAPSSDQDYEGYFATPWAGSTGYFDLNGTGVVNVGYDTGGTYTINNVSSFTYWHEYEDGVEGDFIGVNSNSMPAPDWTNKVSTPLTQDTTITVYYDYDV